MRTFIAALLLLVALPVISGKASAFPNRSLVEPASHSPKRYPSEIAPTPGPVDAIQASYAAAINSSGQIVGTAVPSVGTGFEAFMWRRGSTTLLDPVPDYYQSYANAVNASGKSVGFGLRLADGAYRALLFREDGAPIELLTTAEAEAIDINERGQVVGVFLFSPTDLHAFLWDGGVFTDLGVCNAIREPFAAYGNLAINDAGVVVGTVSETESFIWKKGVRTPLTFGARALNNRSQVVGGSTLWEDGVVTDLGSLGGGSTDAQAINARGQIAGVSRNASGELHLFLWERGRMEDLGIATGLGCPGCERHVTGLNERGQVLAQSFNAVWVWERGGRAGPTPVALLPAGLSMITSGINDPGKVFFTVEGGPGGTVKIHGFLWTRGETISLEDPDTFPGGGNPGVGAIEHSERSGGGALIASPLALELAGTNPFSSETSVRYTLPAATRVALRVYDAGGRLVRDLFSGSSEAGTHTVRWDGADANGHAVAPGLYFTRLNAGLESRTLRLIRIP